jgi:hypothetical protein
VEEGDPERRPQEDLIATALVLLHWPPKSEEAAV